MGETNNRTGRLKIINENKNENIKNKAYIDRTRLNIKLMSKLRINFLSLKAFEIALKNESVMHMWNFETCIACLPK